MYTPFSIVGPTENDFHKITYNKHPTLSSEKHLSISRQFKNIYRNDSFEL